MNSSNDCTRTVLMACVTVLFLAASGCAVEPVDSVDESSSAQSAATPPGSYVPPYVPPKDKTVEIPVEIGGHEFPIRATYKFACSREGASCISHPNFSIGPLLNVCIEGTCKKRGLYPYPDELICEPGYGAKIACDADDRVNECVDEWFDGRDRVTNEDPKQNDFCGHGLWWKNGAGSSMPRYQMGAYFMSRCLDQISKHCQANPTIPACKKVGDPTKCTSYSAP